MARLVRSHLAERDIIEIIEYTSKQWGEEQAWQYVDIIARAEKAVARSPKRGRPFHPKRPGVFVYPLKRVGRGARHILFYRVTSSGTVRILRVLHDVMDFGQHIQ